MSTESQAVPERILERIKKALNLANANDDHEAQTSMLLAQKMMAKYGLDIEDVEDVNVNTADKIIEMYATPAERTLWWKKALAAVISDNFRCYSITKAQRGRGTSRLVFMGRKNDTMIAREVFNFAVASVQAFSLAYLNEAGVVGITERSRVQNDYIYGFIQGLQSKFNEQVEKEELGLAIIKDDALVEVFEDMNLKSGASTTISSAGSAEAYTKGFEDGNRMDHNTKHID